jgi:hypothetical protein
MQKMVYILAEPGDRAGTGEGQMAFEVRGYMDLIRLL